MAATHVLIPTIEWNQFKKDMKLLVKAKESEDCITANQACKLLEIERKTLTNRTCDGTIPPDCITIDILGKKRFNKLMLMGLMPTSQTTTLQKTISK